jgi:uncharacterized protein
MSRSASRLVLATLWLVALLGFAVASTAVTADAGVRPLPSVARVVDEAGVLQPYEKQALVNRLADFEARKGSQIAVVIVATTQPEAIEQFGIRLADEWKLGRSGVDDGALLIIATEDRRFRWEVGRGLEGVLTDLGTARISDEYLRPAFRRGDYASGITAAIDRAIGLVDGEPLPPPPHSRVTVTTNSIHHVLGLLGFAIFLGVMLRSLLGRIGGAFVAASLAAAAGYFLLGTVLVSAVLFVLSFIATLVAGFTGLWGFYGGGFRSRGGFGGGGFGGGGFSGGGGGFSGGGSSGSW